MLIALVFWAATILLILTAIKLWRAPSNHPSYNRPPWWVWKNSLWRGYRRTLLPASLVAMSFAFALTLPESTGVYFGLAGFVIFFLLMVPIVLFNWPKILVPPASRGDRGVLSALRRKAGARDESA